MFATIQVRLLLLVFIVAIPLVLANLFVIDRLAAGQAAAQKETLVGTTRALAAAVDAEMSKYAVLGYSLATSASLDIGDLERFQKEGTEAVSRLPGAWVVVADVKGQQLANTLRPFGQKLPGVVPLEIHQKALVGGKDEISGLQIGPVAQRLALGIFVPVYRQGQPQFTIVVGLEAAVFGQVLENQKLPAGWVAGIGDRQGNFVARSVENNRNVGKPISSGWLAASRASQEGFIENTSVEGTSLISAFTNLEKSGWTVSIGASKTLLQSSMSSSLWVVALVSLSLVTVSLTFSWFAARSIVQSMKSLEVASSALLDGGPIRVKRTGLNEVDHALSAFEGAAISIVEREKRHGLLVDELNHRVKNTLAIVQSMARLAKKNATSVADFTTSFLSRIISLAHTHDLLTKNSWDTVSLGEIVRSELGIYQTTESERILIHEDPIFLHSNDAVAVGMIIHELATNAAKYGALSKESGRVKISLMNAGDAEIQIGWREENGPPVKSPENTGFGSKLIKNLVEGLGGISAIEFAPYGIYFSMRFPKSAG